MLMHYVYTVRQPLSLLGARTALYALAFYHGLVLAIPANLYSVPIWCMQVPYIEDPNTGTAMFESNEIIKYLNDTYAV